MKRLLTYLFLVIGLGLIFSGSTFAKEKVYFCAKGGSSGDGVAYISAIPCSKIKVGQAYKKWKKISAKKYITEIIDAYGPADSVIQSLYDDFEKHNLDTDIITKIVEKEKKKSKSQIAKDKKKREQAAKEGKWGIFTGESTAGVIAMCLDKNNLDKVRLSYFDDFESYKKFGSFKKGQCNYAITQQLNPLLFEKLWKNVLSKEKYEIEKKYIEKYIGWTQEIFYVSPKGEMIEVVALVFFEPNQIDKDGTPKVYTKNFYYEVDLKNNEDSFTVTVRSKIDKNIFIKRTKLTKKEATQAALKGCHTLYELRQDLLTNKKKQKKLMDACYVSSEEINKQEKEKHEHPSPDKNLKLKPRGPEKEQEPLGTIPPATHWTSASRRGRKRGGLRERAAAKVGGGDRPGPFLFLRSLGNCPFQISNSQLTIVLCRQLPGGGLSGGLGGGGDARS